VAIYEPRLLLSDVDREILALLAQLALTAGGQDRSNIPSDAVALSQSEAEHLLQLLEQFASSRLFLEGAYFSEGLARGEGWQNDRLKEIYFSWRVRRGRTRVASTQGWREFTLRAGFNTSENAWMWPRDPRREPLRPMPLEYFVAMERKLISASGIHPRVGALIIEFIENALPYLRAIRERNATVEEGAIKRGVDRFVLDLRDHVRGREKTSMTRRRIVALSTIVMDVSALFATRDWTATGVLSGLAAIAPDALNYGVGVKD
jgi:hypothetical protein